MPFKAGDYVRVRGRILRGYHEDKGEQWEMYDLQLATGQHVQTSVKNLEFDDDRQKAALSAATDRSKPVKRDEKPTEEELLEERLHHATPQESTPPTEELRVPQAPPTDATEDEDKIGPDGEPHKRRSSPARKKT